MTPMERSQALHLHVLDIDSDSRGCVLLGHLCWCEAAVRANSDHLFLDYTSLVESTPRQMQAVTTLCLETGLQCSQKGVHCNLHSFGKDHCFPESVLRCVKLIVSATLSKDPSKLQRLALHCPRYIAASAEDHRYHLPSTLQVRELSFSPLMTPPIRSSNHTAANLQKHGPGAKQSEGKCPFPSIMYASFLTDALYSCGWSWVLLGPGL